MGGRVAVHMQSVAALEHTKLFRHASPEERKKFKFVMETFSFVLHPHVHSDCLSGLLAYTAGVLCFACRPDWYKYVTLEAGAVSRLHVGPSACAELWNLCEVFGQVASDLKQSIVDSELAQRAKRKAENMDMFFSEHSLCHWIHNEVALQPFRKPSVSDWEPESAVPSAPEHAPQPACEDLEADGTGTCLTARESLNASELVVDILLEGELSG